MHKVPGDVEVTFSLSDDTYQPGPTALTVAGYDATYQELPYSGEGAPTHVWIVDIDGTSVTVTVASQPSTSAAVLAEAKAIVESIRLEPTTTSTGFRLTFALQAGWDSG